SALGASLPGRGRGSTGFAGRGILAGAIPACRVRVGRGPLDGSSSSTSTSSTATYLGSLSFSSVSSSSRLGGGVARPGFGTGRGAMLADPPNGFGRLPGVAANLGVAGRMSGASALSSSSVLLAGLAKGLLAGLSAPGFGPKGLG